MNLAPAALVGAQWLSDHLLVVTLTMALVALAIEGLWRVSAAAPNKAAQTASPRSASLWASTWLANSALLACTMMLLWLLSPWLSPLFSDALGGRTGLLVWMGADQWSFAVYVVVGVLLLDLLIYGLHRVMHTVPIFWRAHQVHHRDTEMNASTHFRQHPLQLIATVAMQLSLVWLLGISGISWVIYAVLSAAVELWHHAILRMPKRVDRWLSFVVVTPQFHRVHHHPERRFHDANFGSVLPLWDRLFGTVASVPVNGKPYAKTGLHDWQPETSGRSLSLASCLLMPFQRARVTAAPSAATLATTTVAARQRKAHQKLQTIDGGNHD